jgi:hypothetical protein
MAFSLSPFRDDTLTSASDTTTRTSRPPFAVSAAATAADDAGNGAGGKPPPQIVFSPGHLQGSAAFGAKSTSGASGTGGSKWGSSGQKIVP